MGIPDHLTCLLRNLYVGQEATVRTGHGKMDWFQIGKGVHQGCILSPCLFNFCAEYILRNPGFDEAPTGIKIAGRNIHNLRYENDTTLRAESEEELLTFIKRRVKKLAWSSSFRKIISWHPVPSLQGKEMGKQWKQWQTLCFGAPRSLQMVTEAMKLRHLLLRRKVMTNLDNVIKSRDITLPKVHLVKAMVFPVVMCRWLPWWLRG